MKEKFASLRVCLLSTFPPTKGGVADYTEYLAANLHELGLEVTILSYNADSSPENAEPYSVIRLPKDAPSLPIQIAKRIEEISPDIVHVQSTQFLHPRRAFLFPWFLTNTVPIVTTAHEVPGLRQFHMLPFQKILYRHTEHCIVHTDQVSEKLNERGLAEIESITKIPHGAPVKLFNNGEYEPANPPQILFFGFLRPGKGILKLIESFERLKEQGSDVQLILAGGLPASQQNPNPLSNDFKAEVTDRIADSPWSDDIRLTGYVPEEKVPQYFKDAAVLVFPYEGSDQSGPLHIGLAAGKPIVAHDIGGFSEILTDGKTGLLYSPNSPEQLANTLETVLNDSELRNRLAQNTREKAESISWRNIAQQTIDLYRIL